MPETIKKLGIFKHLIDVLTTKQHQILV